MRSKDVFCYAMLNPKHGSIAIIAEIKLASPSEGVLGTADDIVARVRQYEQAGADAISIVTEKYFFHGEIGFVGKIKKEVSLPVLQKDLVIDEYQIYESKLAGADAILLLARILAKENLVYFVKKAQEIGLEPIVEINTEEDLKKALATNTKITAVNARDLDTFEVDIDKACQLLKKIPKKFIKLGFSGIKGKTEMEKYKNSGANGVLIGTSLMRSKNISEFIERIRI